MFVENYFKMSELLNKDSLTYDHIENICRKHKVTISELCRRAGIDRQLMYSWQQKDAKSIVALKAINVELMKLEIQPDDFAENDALVEGVAVPENRFCKKQNGPCAFECGDNPCKLTT